MSLSPLSNRTLLDQQLERLYAAISAGELPSWPDSLPALVEDIAFTKPHGKRQQWLDALVALPEITPSAVDFSADRLQIGQQGDCTDTQHTQLRELLQVFIPWRKGPFELFGIHIDTCLLYTSPSPRDLSTSRMPSSA